MRGVKTLVVAMSLMIVLCIELLVYGVATKFPDTSAAAPTQTLNLPAKSLIRQVTGFKNGLAIYISQTDGDHILIYNPGTQKTETDIKIQKNTP